MQRREEGAVTVMLNRSVFPTEFLRNQKSEELLPHNEKYYQQCLVYIENAKTLDRRLSKEELKQLVLLQIREAQLDGKRAEQRLGDDPVMFVYRLAQERVAAMPSKLFVDYWHFALYAFMLYLVGYAFFAFLLSAWRGYLLDEAFQVLMPFSAGGLALCLLFELAGFLHLFYQRRISKLLHTDKTALQKVLQNVSYVWIAASFLWPYFLLRLDILLFQAPLWQVLFIGVAGLLVSRYRFLKTNTLPE